MPTLTLVRGLPGSGKSTFAETLLETNPSAVHFEADQFFMKWPLGYTYDIKLIGAAHDWCYGNVVRALWQGSDVVVSNTFTQLWELERYLAIPLLLGAVKVEVVEMKTFYGSIHDIPDDKFALMAARWEAIPEQWIDDGMKVMYIDDKEMRRLEKLRME